MRDHVVGHVVLGIQEKIGRRLARSRQRGGQRRGDILLGQPHLGDAGAVSLETQFRLADGLLHARIGNAGHTAQLAQDAIAESGGLVQIVAGDLYVNRGRGAEIQNLADNIGGREGECHAGKIARQFLAQPPHIVGGGPVAFLQRDQDIAVAGADGAGIVIGDIGRAGGKTDIVDDRVHLAGGNDAADIGFDAGEFRQGVFQAGASRQTGVQHHLTGINGGEEIRAEEGHKPERYQHQRHEDGDEQAPAHHGQRQQVAIAFAHGGDAILELALQPGQRIAAFGMMAQCAHLVGPQQIHRHGRHQRAR